MKRTISLSLSFLIICAVFSQTRYSFIENKGQWGNDFLFRSDIPGGTMFLENGGITYHLIDLEAWHDMHGKPNPQGIDPIIRGHVIKVNFIGGNKPERVELQDKHTNYNNYFLGNDPTRWVSKIHPHGTVLMKNIWNGVDVKYYNAGGRLKYDLILAPGTNVSQIKLAYNGADKIMLKDESLVISTSLGEIIEEKPYAYQIINNEKVEIGCKYVLENNTLSYKLNQPMDATLPIIIDPTLIFATYSGATADNFGMTATYDLQGNLYAGGTSYGPGYPVTVGAYQTTATAGLAITGITDVAISKFTADGTSLIYSTYLGGGTASTGAETVNSMIVNLNNELCLYGITGSNNFPVTTGAYDTTFSGGPAVNLSSNIGVNFTAGTDLYVTRFSLDGTNILGSTYIGGTSSDGLNYNNDLGYYDLCVNYGDQFRGEIFLDSNNNIYVTSTTRSTDFPTVNPYQGSLSGAQDAVIFKLTPDCSTLMYSTYLGGTGKDAGYGIKVVNHDEVYVTGGTTSADFPTDSTSYQPAFAGGTTDAFIIKLDSLGSNLLASTLFGTNQYDQSYFVEVDVDEDVYIYGQTLSPATFPTLNTTYVNPNSCQFISKFSPALDSIIYSTKFGNDNGAINICPTAFLVDFCENVYISGWGANILTVSPLTGMPVSPDAMQPSSGDGFNFYLAVFETDMSSMYYGSYFGGAISREHVDGGTSRFDKNGVVYQAVCAGCGSNDDFPTTPGVWSNTNNSGNCNNGLFKFEFSFTGVQANFLAPDSICLNYSFPLTNTSTGNINLYQWNFGDGNTSNVASPTHTYTTPGTYLIQLIVEDTSLSTCISIDTAYRTIIVIDGDGTSTLPDIPICQGESVNIGIPSTPSYVYTWNPTSFLSSGTVADPVATPPTTTSYTLLVDNGICIDTMFREVLVDLPPNADFDYISYVSCYGVSLKLNNLSTGSDSIRFYLNNIPLVVGQDSINLDWSNSYVISLFVYNGECVDSTSLTFNSGNFGDLFELTMPNVFTPFTTPGENDDFCPIGLNGEYCYRLHVYNRWGVEIWDSEIDEPCWDGRHKDTENNAVDGVYYYVLEFLGGDQAGCFYLISHAD